MIDYKDIQKFTSYGYWRADFAFKNITEQITDWQNKYGLELNPDFQRGHVWSEAQQTSFVEYVLKGGRGAKQILFNAVGWDRHTNITDFVLVDGLQRVTAVMLFLDDKLPVFDGNYVSDFVSTGWMVDTMMCGFQFIVNNLQTREEVLRWYLELNSGGVIHTKEELDRVRELLDKEGSNG